jgi:hypothetical protein
MDWKITAKAHHTCRGDKVPSLFEDKPADQRGTTAREMRVHRLRA